MIQPLISFCIPTYNFGAFIGETLDSIIEQADGDVEIIVIDGGSTDNTAEVVASRSEMFPNIRYLNVGGGRGVDRDIVESVVQARGEYCWLMGSDDVLVPGAVSAIRRELRENWDVLLIGFWICDLQLKPMWRHPILRVDQPRTWDWSSETQRRDYFSKAQTSTALFSFISGVIFRRRIWDDRIESDRFLGSCWIIAARMFDVARDGLQVRYLPEPLLLKRGDNDSFLSRGLARRIELSVRGFQDVADHYLGSDSFESRQVTRVLQTEYSVVRLLGYKVHLARSGKLDEWSEIARLADQLFRGPGWRNRARRAVVHWAQPWILYAATPLARAIFRMYCRIQRTPS